MKELLPLGSVIKVKTNLGGSILLMIIGYFPFDEETKDLYDYATVAFPFGIQSEQVIQLINHDSIESVEFEGYQDEESKIFTQNLPFVLVKSMEALKLMRDEQNSEKQKGPDEAFG